MGKIDAGKTGASGNRPTNTSLSYTLGHLNSVVEIELERGSGAVDTWEPLDELNGRRLARFEMSKKGVDRFLAHLARMKTHFAFTGAFKVRSANDFPSDCGLASSASSFAALTQATLAALSELTGCAPLSVAQAAEWSRQGSGSSCRSFFAPWSVWDAEGAHAADGLGYSDLIHQVIVVNEHKKAVSSSEAHLRVASSLLFAARPERAEQRVRDLMTCLRDRDWRAAFEITWAEFWDMHALFETSQPSFGYMTEGSLEVLRWVRENTWDAIGDGPLITMDAGPNVHLLFRGGDEGRVMARRVLEKFDGRFKVISSEDLR